MPFAAYRSIDSPPALVTKITRWSPRWNAWPASSLASPLIPPTIFVQEISASVSAADARSTSCGLVQATIHWPGSSARKSSRSATLLLGLHSRTLPSLVKPALSSVS